MKNGNFHLQVKDTERWAGLGGDATEEIRVSGRTASQFGTSSVGKLKVSVGGRGKAESPSYITCMQSGGPEGSAQSIP